MSRSIQHLLPHGQLTSDYRGMIQDPHVFIPRKPLGGKSRVLEVRPMYGAFRYGDLLRLATRGVVPKLKGVKEFTPKWSMAFYHAWMEMPENVRFQILNVFDKQGHHFARTLEIAMRDCGVV